MLDDIKKKDKQLETDQEYMLWVNNFSLWKQIHDSKQVPHGEEDALPIMSDELGYLDEFLNKLDSQKQIKNNQIKRWTEWQ